MPRKRSPAPPPRAVLAPLGVLVGAVMLGFPALLKAEGLAREALSSFSDDTLQLAYTNLAEVRSLSVYPQIRQRLLSGQFRNFLDFLRSTGTDPERDVDEVMLGWRGSDSANFFGLASGRFQPEQAGQFIAQQQLPSRQYAGSDLYAFGSGQGATDIFFTFLSSSLAAFGRLNDLTALLDARSGVRPALDTKGNVVSWEAELEGSAPQWGIVTGKATANFAATWLTGGAKPAGDLSAVVGPVQAALYQVSWSSGFSIQLSIICQNGETAAALAKVLTLLRDSRPATNDHISPEISSFFQGLSIDTNGSRVELGGSGPVEVAEQVLHGAMSGPAH